MLDVIPPDELAIQWDTAVEFAILEGLLPSFLSNPEADIIERLVRLGSRVPDRVETGYHLCYGDVEHQHFVEPTDTTKLVNIANGVCAGVTRTVNWMHMPVPRGRHGRGVLRAAARPATAAGDRVLSRSRAFD